MVHFVTSYTKQNKTRKQTLETAQYGLESALSLRSIFHVEFVTEKTLSGQLAKQNL